MRPPTPPPEPNARKAAPLRPPPPVRSAAPMPPMRPPPVRPRPRPMPKPRLPSKLGSAGPKREGPAAAAPTPPARQLSVRWPPARGAFEPAGPGQPVRKQLCWLKSAQRGWELQLRLACPHDFLLVCAAMISPAHSLPTSMPHQSIPTGPQCTRDPHLPPRCQPPSGHWCANCPHQHPCRLCWSATHCQHRRPQPGASSCPPRLPRGLAPGVGHRSTPGSAARHRLGRQQRLPPRRHHPSARCPAAPPARARPPASCARRCWCQSGCCW